jgi:carbamoyltransferase
MTAILGISAFYHDSAAALILDGRVAAAAQEERFTRIKHDHRFPVHAARYCLESAGLSIGDVDFVAFYDKPIAKFERMLETYLAYAPRGYSSFRTALPTWLKQKLFLPREMDRGLGGRFRNGRGRYIFVEHHESHAASAFFPSPFDEAAILTLDGVGEWSTSCMGFGRGERIELTHEIRFPHSLGLLYSAFTFHLGFKVNSGEYKVMGLAPYGEPRFKDRILEKLVDLKEDGSFRLDMSHFAYAAGLTMTSPKFDELFDGPARKPESLLTQREMDMAASLQAATEEIVLRCARHLRRTTGMKHLALAGGVALNCVANGKILREGIFDELWIQPAAGDAGGALGAAWMTWRQLLGNPRSPGGRDAQAGSLLGPEFSDQEIVAFLESQGVEYDVAADDDELCRMTAELLAAEKIVGWFQGRMEFGPRALGARSILGDARSPKMQSAMNLKIKFRESFRPFAPIVLRERVHDWFETSPELDSPYMLLVAAVRPEHRVAPPPGYEKAWGIEKLNYARSTVPAITHVDHSARLQTVDAERNPLLHRLLKRFEAETGCPMLVNTSFNVRSEPIVCTPEDAFRCFMATEIDVLALGRRVLRKDRMKKATMDDKAREAHLAQFKPD